MKNPIPNQVAGEYGITAFTGTDRPEPSEAQRAAAKAADRIFGRNLRPQFDCTDAEYQTRLTEMVNDSALGSQILLGYENGGFLRPRKDLILSKSAINRYLAREHDRVATLPKGVK